jgi:alpha-ketoglutarate-dependent taurine dioxygenase
MVRKEYLMKNKINSLKFTASFENQLPELIKKSLDTNGYVILKNYPCKSKIDFLDLCQRIGKPTPHDGRGVLIWDIKSNPSSESLLKTFSEHNNEATLHTDSQYSEYPEDYFALMCIKKASCGGGISYLLSLNSILLELKNTLKGRRAISVLGKEQFPFIVPSIFSKSNNGESINYGFILKGNEIRFRIDTIEKALENSTVSMSKEMIEAFQYLKKKVTESKKVLEFHLEENDIVFINNKTMLHGRSSFTDMERHLLRIRLNRN